MTGAALLALIGVFAQVSVQDQALLDELSYKAFRFFWEQSNPTTGFTKDRAANLVGSDPYTVASIASTGFALAANAIGVERGWITRNQGLVRTRITMQSLNTVAPRVNGWFYHFIHWQTGARMWGSEVSSIDTAILLSGALVAERYFRDATVTNEFNSLLGAVDWHWMLTDGGTKPGSLTFCHGWTPESGFLPYRWDSYAEHMMLYILALGAWQDMPAASWTAFSRPVVSYFGYDLFGGGPLFLHQMSQSFLDFSRTRDVLGLDYWTSGKNHTLANRLYCINNPKGYAGYGPNFWGLSAGDTPDGYKALGAPGWGEDNGTVIPTSAIASMIYTPTESMAAAEHFRNNHANAYGRYGFSNGINPSRSWVGPDVIGIDLGMMLLALENYRSGLPHRLYHSHPVVERGFKRAGFWPRSQALD